MLEKLHTHSAQETFLSMLNTVVLLNIFHGNCDTFFMDSFNRRLNKMLKEQYLF